MPWPSGALAVSFSARTRWGSRAVIGWSYGSPLPHVQHLERPVLPQPRVRPAQRDDARVAVGADAREARGAADAGGIEDGLARPDRDGAALAREQGAAVVAA